MQTIQSNVKLAVAITSILLWISVGTITYHFLENWNWIQSFYFSVESVTTVGYGDLHPTTDLSRLITAIYILFGVGIVVTSLGVVGTSYIADREQKIIHAENRRRRRKQ